MIKNYGISGFLVILIDYLITKVLFRKARIVRFPFRVRGRSFIDFGQGLTTGVDCRIDAFPVDKNKVIFFGENVQINDHVHIGAVERIEIGNNVLIASKVFITDHNHGVYSGEVEHSDPSTPPHLRNLVSSPVYIKDNVWIGELVSILPGVTVGEGSIIGSNSVVSKSIPPYSIAVGVPAKVVKQYDFELRKWVKCD